MIYVLPLPQPRCMHYCNITDHTITLLYWLSCQKLLKVIYFVHTIDVWGHFMSAKPPIYSYQAICGGVKSAIMMALSDRKSLLRRCSSLTYLGVNFSIVLVKDTYNSPMRARHGKSFVRYLFYQCQFCDVLMLCCTMIYMHNCLHQENFTLNLSKSM